MAPPPRVLIVDDNPADIDLMQMAFVEAGIDVTCTIAADGIEAQRALERAETVSESPVLVLLDLNLPRASGFDVLQFMRSRGIDRSRTSVVMMTTSTSSHDRSRALALGAAEFLTKPPLFDQLVDIARHLSIYLVDGGSRPVVDGAGAADLPLQAAWENAPAPITAPLSRDLAAKPSHSAPPSEAARRLFANGGDMGNLMLATDWSRTPIGPVESWPSALRSAIAILLECRLPMYIAWGRDFTQFYNDAYRPILGTLKHPQAMGTSARTTWTEIWATIGPMWDEIWKGKSFGFDDFKLTIERHGYPEDCYFNFSYSPVRDDAGEVGGVLVTFAETTQRVLSERRLAHEHERLQSIFMQAPASIAIFKGPEHVYEFANPPYLRMTGRDSLVGKSIRQAFPEIKDSGIYEILDQVWRTGEPFVVAEYPVPLRKHPDAEPELCYFSFNLYPLRDEAGSIFGQIVVAIDITAQVHARQKVESLTKDIAAREAEYRELSEAIPQLVWRTDAGGRFTHANARWTEYTGLTLEATQKTDFREIVHPEDYGRVMSTWAQALAKLEPYEVEFRMRIVKDGSYRWFLIRTHPIRDAHGTVTDWFGTSTDIHEQREAFHALTLKDAQLEQRAIELARSNAELEQFAAITAHDLQEPIRMIISYLQMIDRKAGPLLDAKSKEYMDIVTSSASRMRLMVTSILAYSRIGKEGEPPTMVRIADAVKSAVDLLADVVASSHATIDVSDLPTVYAVPSQIIRLFQNLISNALKFHGPDAPRIRISADTADGTWVFCVEDNGVGIDPKEGERLFGLFQRLHNTSDIPGTGIGLASCKKIVEQHEGRIWFERSSLGGTAFNFTLPATRRAGL